jgi:FkbM family methyltransferase
VNVLDRYLGDDRLRLVDVGARAGVSPRWERFHGVLDVTAFEPDSSELERLRSTAHSLPYPARFLPDALWRESTDDVPFHITNWPVASSVYPPNSEFLQSFPDAAGLFAVREVRSIPVSTLDEVTQREGLLVDCLKVDVEGAALDVLVGGERTLRDTLALEVEAEMNPLFEGEALFPQVDSHLRERGWVLHGIRRTSWRRGTHLGPAASGLGGQIVSVDALYFNDALRAAGLSLQRELKLLVILAAYLQTDAVLDRMRSPHRLAEELDAEELEALENFLVPRPGRFRRLTRRALGRWSSARRRAFADRLQRGEEGVWEDPHFF